MVYFPIIFLLFYFCNAVRCNPLNRFFSGLSDEQLLTVYFHSTVFSSTAAMVVTTVRVYTSCIRSTAFFSRLSDGKPLFSILHFINASNRKKIGCTLLNIRSTAFFSRLSDGMLFPQTFFVHRTQKYFFNFNYSIHKETIQNNQLKRGSECAQAAFTKIIIFKQRI